MSNAVIIVSMNDSHINNKLPVSSKRKEHQGRLQLDQLTPTRAHVTRLPARVATLAFSLQTPKTCATLILQICACLPLFLVKHISY